MKLRYAVVFEQTPNNYCAYVPDVPGCVSTGKTWDDIRGMIQEALIFHIEDMVGRGEPIPEPQLSIDDAIAHHKEPLEDYVLRNYREFGDSEPTISATFQMVEFEVATLEEAKIG